MLYLSKDKLVAVAGGRGMSLSALARAAGVSRQSLYNLFEDQPVFTGPFVKVLQFLGVSFHDLVDEFSPAEQLLADAPAAIQRTVARLTQFCQFNAASLVLFGSRLRGKSGAHVDWDLGVWFTGAPRSQALRNVQADLEDSAFPYRVDIVNLNDAPAWFRKQVDNQHLVLYGSYP